MKSLRAHLVCCFVVVVLAVLPAQVAAAETIYVSTGAGQQILAFSDSGVVTGVCNMTFGGNGVTPEDLVVGPDGQLYIADPTGNRIFRVSPGSVALPATDCGATAIYDQSALAANACTDVAKNPINCPAGPEGPSFLRIATLDLYFNTHGAGTGVWKIPGIANSGATATCSTLACPAPVQVAAANFSGEGIDFDTFGKLLAVDQTDGAVVRDPVSCFDGTTPRPAKCFSNFITGLSRPVGVAINGCGDILATSGNAINRYSATTSSITPLDTRSFSGHNTPMFLEVDSSGRIFVITAGDETGKNATLWRLDPPANSPPTTSTGPQPCPLRLYTTGLTLPLSKNLASGIASANGLGLGISASDATLDAMFDSDTPTRTFNFGQHSFTVTCNGINQSFTLDVTAVKSRPTDAANPEVSFGNTPGTQSLLAAPPLCPNAIVNPGCVHYGGEHGFCIQYLEQSSPVDANVACTASSPLTFLAVFDSAEPINDPGGAHVSSLDVTDPFEECQSQDFYSQLPTGDPVRLTGTNSKHVVFNSDLMVDPPGIISLNSPISSCSVNNGITTCNPQFNIGQNINVKFTLLQAGSPLTTATEQLSIARTSHTVKGKLFPEFVPQTVVSTKNSATLNFFVPNSSGQYSYNVDSSFFDKQFAKGTTATYQFTIWGNGAAPVSFFTTGTF